MELWGLTPGSISSPLAYCLKKIRYPCHRLTRRFHLTPQSGLPVNAPIRAPGALFLPAV